MSTAVQNPLFARLYTRMTEHERPEQIEHRGELLAGLAGHVLELGAGNGRNFDLYPTEVAEVVGVEPEPYLRERALRSARQAHPPVRIVDAVADALPFEDASFDAAIACLLPPDKRCGLKRPRWGGAAE